MYAYDCASISVLRDLGSRDARNSPLQQAVHLTLRTVPWFHAEVNRRPPWGSNKARRWTESCAMFGSASTASSSRRPSRCTRVASRRRPADARKQLAIGMTDRDRGGHGRGDRERGSSPCRVAESPLACAEGARGQPRRPRRPRGCQVANRGRLRPVGDVVAATRGDNWVRRDRSSGGYARSGA